MTVTDIYTAQALGSTDAGVLEPQKVTLEATATVIAVSAQLTNGAAFGDPTKRPRLYFATSPFDLTAAVGAVQLQSPDCSFIELVPNAAPGGIKITSSPAEAVRGGYFYAWLDVPKMGATAAISAKLVQFD